MLGEGVSTSRARDLGLRVGRRVPLLTCQLNTWTSVSLDAKSTEHFHADPHRDRAGKLVRKVGFADKVVGNSYGDVVGLGLAEPLTISRTRCARYARPYSPCLDKYWYAVC